MTHHPIGPTKIEKKVMPDTKRILFTAVLILSLLLNIYFVTVQPAREDLLILKDTINLLEKSNAELNKQVYLYNLSIQNYESQLDLYRHRISELEGKLGSTASGLEGSAELQAPAVIQRVEYISNYPFARQQVVQEGSMIDISVEIKPGRGRVLVQTRPLMGVVFQDAANTAVYVAQNWTGKDLSGSDIIFSIEADQEIPSVDGSSAGALMTLLAVSALEDRTLKQDITLTGTIDRFGHIGEIGGLIEKASAAKDAGKTLILIPRENSRLIRYTEKTRNFYGLTIIETVPEIIDAKEYIEAASGIKVEYVDTIDDVLKFAT